MRTDVSKLVVEHVRDRINGIMTGDYLLMDYLRTRSVGQLCMCERARAREGGREGERVRDLGDGSQRERKGENIPSQEFAL